MEKSKRIGAINKFKSRQLLLEHKSVHKNALSNAAKVISPIAKYDSAGTLSCSICRTTIKSESVWKVHINSKQHIQKLQAASLAVKSQLTAITPCPVAEKSKVEKKLPVITNITSSVPEKKTFQQDTSVPETTTQDKALPDKFFDDPIKDAKAHNKEYKDSQDEEWNRFMREIKGETDMSNIIISVEQNDVNVKRHLKEIDEQLEKYAKVIEIDEKKQRIMNRKKTIIAKPSSGDESSSSEDNYTIDNFSDWRLKRIQIKKP